MIKLNKNFRCPIVIIQCLLLFNLITFIKPDNPEWIEYNFNNYSAEYKHTSGAKSQTIGVEFYVPREIPSYMKVTIFPDENTSTPLLCFSGENPICDNSREVLYKRTDGLTSMIYIKKEQFIDGDLFISVICQDSGCKYTLKFEGAQTAKIDANSVFSYLVTNNNREMRFTAIGDVEEGSFLTVGVEGSSSVQISIDNVKDYDQHKFDTGGIVTFPIVNTNSTTLATFTIKGANPGEFLTLNVHVVYNCEAKDNLLYPNGPTVMGMLSDKKEYCKEECFPVSALATGKYSNVNKFFLTGKIHSKYALFWLADENNMYMESTEIEIRDGLLSFMIETNGLKRSICFEFSYDWDVRMNYVAYSISLLETTKMERIYNFNPPQTMGQTYRRMIPKGAYAVYHPTSISTSDKRLNYYMYNRKGVAEMYTYTCLSYPDCTYESETIQKFNKPKRINRMTVYDKEIDKDYGGMDSEKQVMIVYCKDDDNENNGFCEVDVSFNTPGKSMPLIENEQFSKYALEEEKGTIKIELQSGIKVQTLIIDIMIYSGDIVFNIKDFDSKLADISQIKYYLSNKIVYYFNFAQLSFDIIELEYISYLNSFFTIKYEINPNDIKRLYELILSDENYLVEIDPSPDVKYKTIYLENYRIKKNKPFLVNFYSLNCEFQVKNKNTGKEISFSDGYTQEILLSNMEGYNSFNYQYEIKVLKTEFSNYHHKMCMLYVTGYESPDTESQTEIVVGENVNQKIIFTKYFKSIRFLYPHADPEKDLTIYINIIDQAYYNVKIYVNSDDYSFKQFNITTSQIFYLPGYEIVNYCIKNTLCSIIVEIELTNYLSSIYNTEEQKIEIAFRPIKNTPSYLKKNIAKKDFTCGDHYYYLYTDIDKNEIVEVYINFLRNYGNIWGKIAIKDKNSIDEEATWKGVYRMPSPDWEDFLPNNEYTKKIEILPEDTADCIEGCYLLLSIRIFQIGDYVDDSKFYPFSIITRTIFKDFDIPKVTFKINEYIVGNVDESQNNDINLFYEIWLPYDSYIVEFDFQSELAGLYINVGETKPTTTNADFKLLSQGSDSLLSLSKYEILNKANMKKIEIPHESSLEGINLVIGIWTDKKDSFDTEIFSLAVRLPQDNLDIIEVNTDHKIICRPNFLNDDEFSCLFMVTYDEKDVELRNSLLLYAASVNQTALTYVHASFIEKKYYDEYDTKALKSNTPRIETAQFSTQKNGLDYIYISLNDDCKNKYLYVNVKTNKADDIFILTSLSMNMMYTLPIDSNPTSEKLFFVPSGQLRLNFFTNSKSNIFVNIVPLGGEARIKWYDDPNNIYYLKGRGNKLALTSGVDSKTLIIEKRESSNDKFTSSEDPGFVFYISYNTRNPKINFDKIKENYPVEIVYKQTDLPISLFSILNNVNNNPINIGITFKDLGKNQTGEYNLSSLVIIASIVKENNIYNVKKYYPDLQPKMENFVYGKYDPTLKTAQIFISQEIIESCNVKSEDVPTLYISIEKSKAFIEQNYNKFAIEAQIYQLNDASFYYENIYHYMRYNENTYSNYHRLRINKNIKYMILELSFNSNYLDFAINVAITKLNLTSIIYKYEKRNGKIILLLNDYLGSEFIFLNIFSKTTYIINTSLYNYVFRYYNIENEEEFQKYQILDNNDTLYIGEKTEYNDDTVDTFIECSFNKINLDKYKANITYYLKVINNKSYIKGESYESIALMESPFYTIYERNPNDANGIITLKAKVDLTNTIYLQVIALIEQEDNREYISYKGMEYSSPIPEPEEEEREEEEKEEENEKKEEEEEKEGKEEEKKSEEEEKKEGKEEEGKEEESDDKKDTGPKKQSNSVYLIIIFVMGAIIVILLTLTIIHCCKRRNLPNGIEINDIGLIEPRVMN